MLEAAKIALFCYRLKTWLVALAAHNCPETLVFAKEIGENSPVARGRICEGLEFLGIAVDEPCNTSHAPGISPEDDRGAVSVIPTDEKSLIARAAVGFGSQPRGSSASVS